MTEPKPRKGRGGRKKVPEPSPGPAAIGPPPGPQPITPAVLPPDLGAVTAVKTYERQRDLLVEIAAHLKLNQQDTMLRYMRIMEEDLLHLMSKRQADLRKQSSPPASPPADQP